MVARSGVDVNDREPEVPVPAVSAADPKAATQRLADLQHFLTWDVPLVSRYQPDIAALTAARSKIVPAFGTNSPLLLHRWVAALAGILGRTRA
jgi:hypothetical protein